MLHELVCVCVCVLHEFVCVCVCVCMYVHTVEHLRVLAWASAMDKGNKEWAEAFDHAVEMVCCARCTYVRMCVSVGARVCVSVCVRARICVCFSMHGMNTKSPILYYPVNKTADHQEHDSLRGGI